ncbi:choline transporter-like protein 2 [Gigantopelta aegis]|uniref:choline transporter-like protein 2 n=1 Tax=Gigantopelta aegis TaxID=1735272 RepID=UPI001B887AE5|nr:choline transporter-like protein 2 [Gigantopelta aegis]
MCGGNKVDDEDNTSKSNDANKYGNPKQYDPNFKGPLKNRSCTDIICCILFFVFVLGMAGCSVLGYMRGNPIKLIYPTDSQGNLCGNGAYADKPNLMFFDLLQCAKMGPNVILMGCPTPQVCVKTCTSSYYVYLQTKALELANGGMLNSERNKMLCKYNVDRTAVADVQTLIDNEDCASYYVETTSVIGRCVPSIFSKIADMASTLTTTDSYPLQQADGTNVTGSLLDTGSYYMALFYKYYQYGEMVYKDVVNSWQVILVGLGLTMLLAMIWIVLMRWIAGIMIWFTIFAVLGFLGYSTYFSYVKYYNLKTQNVTATYGLSELFSQNWNTVFNLQQTWLALGCISATVLLILLLILLCLCMRIRIAIELIKEGSRAIGNMFSTLFWPLIPFILELGFITYWIASAVYVASMSDAQYYSGNTTNTSTDGINYVLSRIPCTPNSTTTLNSVCEFVKYGGNQYTIYMQVYMVFMFLWILNFIIALGQMVLAGAFASYYWAYEKPKDIPAFPLAASLWRTVRYHLGSIAFGSLIIAIIQLIRIFLEYLDHKLKGAENAVARFFLKCLKCFFYCLEKFMKFLNKNAYILVAVYGKNFCVSAKDAFFLIMRNIVRTVVLDKTTDFVLFLSKLLITVAVFTGAFFWFDGQIPFLTSYKPELNFYLTPVIILTVTAYLVSCAFFSVYSMAVATIYLCFLEDLEKHDGSPEKPYFMSKSMMSLMGKKNKFKEPSGKD